MLDRDRRMCRRCKEIKPTGDFFKNAYKKDGLSPCCKKCDKVYLDKWRQSDKGKKVVNNNIRKARYRNYNKWVKVAEQINFNKCQKCGYDKCFAAIEFHHPNPNNRESKIKMKFLFMLVPTRKRINILKRTIPLCANCHRELHYKAKSKNLPKNTWRKEVRKR